MPIAIAIACILVLLAIFIAVSNWTCVLLSARNHRRGIDRHYSTVPLVSLLFVAIAYGACPRTPMAWAFVIPMLDIGNAIVIWLPYELLRGPRRQ